MGGKIKNSTVSKIRLSKSKKFFRSIFPKENISNLSMTFISSIGEEEGLFKLDNGNETTYVVFYGNVVSTYGDNEGMFL